MRLNESTAIATTRALLVPYDRRHVPTYHAWMEDPAIQEATASEPLTLEEEYENQESWRASHDKLTFIVCEPLTIGDSCGASNDTESNGNGNSNNISFAPAGKVDSPDRMVGDVNLFLYPYEDEDEDGDDDQPHPSATPEFCVGEVDIMIAGHQHRGKGLGRAVVQEFLQYVARNLAGITREYAEDKDMASASGAGPGLKLLMAKINQGNEKSLALFKSLGFKQEGEVNYFGEVKLVLRDLVTLAAEVPEGYAELVYSREEIQDDGKQQQQ